MTKQNPFKKRVRERMTKTGERYAAARRNLLDETTTPPPPPQGIKGWTLSGATRSAYTLEAVRGTDGTMCACVRSLPDSAPQWTALGQGVDATPYRGARIRFAGRIRTQGLTGDAKLWLRIDVHKAVQLNHSDAFGDDTDFSAAEIVVDVAPDARLLVYGMLVAGDGAAWLRDVVVERVGLDAALTPPLLGRSEPSAPTNLDFAD